MKILFAGTPDFARVALEHLLAAGFDVPLVLTQPDRPAGRGMKLQASPVKQLAQARGIAVAQPRSLRLDGKFPDDAAAARAAIVATQADAMVVAAYGLILPRWVLDAPRMGCLNIHASLLPRWRGAAPIHRAIEAGDALFHGRDQSRTDGRGGVSAHGQGRRLSARRWRPRSGESGRFPRGGSSRGPPRRRWR